MIMMDPHKSVVAIMKKRKAGMPDGASAEGHLTEKDDGNLDPRHMAAEDVMNAFHSKSVPHLKEALANFHDMHMMHREMEEQSGPRNEEDLSMESDRPEL